MVSGREWGCRYSPWDKAPETPSQPQAGVWPVLGGGGGGDATVGCGRNRQLPKNRAQQKMAQRLGQVCEP